MVDKSEWKTPSMGREGRWTPIRAKAQDTRANPNNWETHLVRKRWDIGLLRALSLRIMMMMINKSLYIWEVTTLGRAVISNSCTLLKDIIIFHGDPSTLMPKSWGFNPQNPPGVTCMCICNKFQRRFMLTSE